VQHKLVDQIGDERSAVKWLEANRNISSGLKIVDWKPEAESSGLSSWLFQSIASALGPSAEKIGALAGEIATSLELDGLVSLWHPASN
jgi:protease-4